MFIGIDLGGTNIAGGVVNSDGEILFRTSKPTEAHRGADGVIADIETMIEELIATSGFEIFGIGVGVPGPVDGDLQHIHYCTNLNWHNIDLGKRLSQRFGVPAFVDNDANLAALAEEEVGVLKGSKVGVMITLGTGIGGGIILDGKPYRGVHGLTEIGHMVVGDNFYDCNCGKNGCFETFSSATAIIKYATSLVDQDKHPGSKLNQVVSERPLTARDIFDAAKDGDPLGLDAVDRLVHYLAVGISNLVVVLDPDNIAIGGGVAQAGDYLMDKLKDKVKSMEFVKNFPTAKLLFAELGNDAGIIGAGMLAKIER